MKNTNYFWFLENSATSSSIVGEPILNFNYIYARPDSIYNFLKKIDKRYWENIKKVYVFLDFNAYRAKISS